jgi:hypothetical protein
MAYFPDPTWRSVTDADLAVLAETPGGEGQPEDSLWEQHFCLFALPDHLRASWWDLAAQQVEMGPGRRPDLDAFARAIAAFLQFKKMPLPIPCTFDVVLTTPQQGALGLDDPDGISGEPAPPRTVACINLGDEQTSLVLLPLSRSLREEMLRSGVTEGPSSPLGRTHSFLATFPSYPLVRLFLEPGEGVWFPPVQILFAPGPLDKQDLDVWLMLREPAGPAYAKRDDL